MNRVFNILFFLILISCNGTKVISIDKARKMSSKKDYKTVLDDNVQVDINRRFLDTDNISKVLVDRNLKTIFIYLINKNPESFKLSEIDLIKFNLQNNLTENDSISYVLVNGEFVEKEDRENYILDFNAIQTIKILRDVDPTKLVCSYGSWINILYIKTK